ncbi:1-phosphofructokinase family hexose kinase [Pedobacter caeni]|uniref:6-phosphofructokinase 2 n=1 Tax=Pedobacter caeni TaxID=288992 RepID=A0A1M5BBQ1_9SPHI|nr:1-phosphofructokinase family hexose kinase [Pedobacter caeni]SHF39939.1 6-phosphofructokinase 2 [Pedobacter caeni]
MTSILSVTFNPAIDKSTLVPELIAEKKLNCSSPVYEAGGGGINVSRAIKRLGENTTAIYMAGGYTGRAYTRLLAKEGFDLIPVKTKESTRENLVVKEISSQKQYRFGMPGPATTKREWQNCLKAIANFKQAEFIVVSGSLAPGIPTGIFAEITHIAKKNKAKLIVDTSGEALIQAVKAGVYLIKPNLRELGTLAGREILTLDQIHLAAKEVINKFECEVIVTSMGSQGAVLISKDLFLSVVPPKVAVQSTVGAGDSMLAGIVHSLALNKSLTEAIQYGVACGTAATMNPGTELCHPADVAHLYRLIQSSSSI